jgi:hypothetical protein
LNKETDYQWTVHDYGIYFQGGYCLWKNGRERKQLGKVFDYQTLSESLGNEEEYSHDNMPSNVPIVALVVHTLDGKGVTIPFQELLFLKPKGITFEMPGIGAGYLTRNSNSNFKYKKVFHPNEYSINYPLFDRASNISNKESLLLHRHLSEVKTRIPEFLFNRKRVFNIVNFKRTEAKLAFGTLYNDNYWFHWYPNGLYLFFQNKMVGKLYPEEQHILLKNPTETQTKLAKDIGYEIKVK